MVQKIISISELTKKFGSDLVLNNMSMNVYKGDIYGLLGPNGVGKTTTIKIMLGLLSFENGSINILGVNPMKDGYYLRQKVNALPENYGVYGWMSAFEYLKLFSNLYGYQHTKSTIFEKLTEVGLNPDETKPIKYYSQGMKKRIGIARALINNPELLFLDEPTNGLDPRGRREIHNLLLNLNKEFGVTIIISTHILDDVERLSNRIGILFDGALKYEGDIISNAKDISSKFKFKLDDANVPLSKFEESGLKIIKKEGIFITCEIKNSSTASIIKNLILENIPIIEIKKLTNKVEDLYLKYTGGI